MEVNFLRRHPLFKDIASLAGFIVCVVIGTIIINTFIFRSYSVIGPSMEETLYTGDRLIVNRLPVTIKAIKNERYIPERGQIIVFKNPKLEIGIGDEYIVKRVIAFEGERVVLKNGQYRVYNKTEPNGFNPDDSNKNEPGKPTSGSVDMIVPQNEIFVSGDHRQESYSFDSRNGLGTIPLEDIIGPVLIRLYPFYAIRGF